MLSEIAHDWDRTRDEPTVDAQLQWTHWEGESQNGQISRYMLVYAGLCHLEGQLQPAMGVVVGVHTMHSVPDRSFFGTMTLNVSLFIISNIDSFSLNIACCCNSSTQYCS